MSSSQIAAIQSEPGSQVNERHLDADADECPLPESLRNLLDSSGEGDEAWGAFVAEFTRILLHVVKLMPGTRDERMDAYARILEALRANDYNKLRKYAAVPDSRFTTWLVVVAKRICIDYQRSRFGRADERMSRARLERRATRRQLEDFVAEAGDPESLSAPETELADSRVRECELRNAVESALAQLPPADRLLMRLRFRDGLSSAEIAGVLRQSSSLTVYRRIGRVLATLRLELARRGVDGPLP